MSNDEDVYKVDTVPPPDGEGDAYNAPTRVGAGPPTEVLADMRAAAATGRPLKPKDLPMPASKPSSEIVAPPRAQTDAGASAARVGDAAASAEPAGGFDSAMSTEVPLGRAVTWTFAALALIVGAYALVGR